MNYKYTTVNSVEQVNGMMNWFCLPLMVPPVSADGLAREQQLKELLLPFIIY